ncbi:MAG TPA: hypothetical protein VGN00_13090 [Puia sp.]|jgi:hypothetical protein
MKRIPFLLILLTTYSVYGQGLTQSADGKSTIPIKGASVSLDLAQTDLTIGFNNYDKAVKATSARGIYGASVKAKNAEGIANLFSSGDLVPLGQAQLLAGVTWAGKQEKTENNLNGATVIMARLGKWETRFRKLLNQELKDRIHNACAGIKDEAARARTERNMTDDLEKFKSTPELFETAIEDGPSDTDDIRMAKKMVRTFAKDQHDEYNLVRNKFIDQVANNAQDFSAIAPTRFTIFGFGGISAIGFKLFNKLDTSNLSKSFSNINDRGGNIGIGFNFQYNNCWFGVSYSYESSNNFEELTKKDYTLRTTNTVGSQSLIQETKITGYAGKYGKVELNNFNVDFVYDWGLDDKGNQILINPYLRASIFSRDTSLLLNKTNLGAGFYFFQKDSKFLGGFYIELPDVTNNGEKSKPADQQDIRPALNRLSFGVVTKFNLSSIFSW